MRPRRVGKASLAADNAAAEPEADKLRAKVITFLLKSQNQSPTKTLIISE